MWWSDYSHDKAATISIISLKEIGKNQPWTWLSKTIKMMLVRLPMTDLKITVRADYAASVCSTLPLSGGAGLWTDICPVPQHPPTLSWLQTSRIDQSFPSTNLASLLAFEQQVTNPAFGNNSSFFLLDQVKHMFRFWRR